MAPPGENGQVENTGQESSGMLAVEEILHDRDPIRRKLIEIQSEPQLSSLESKYYKYFNEIYGELLEIITDENHPLSNIKEHKELISLLNNTILICISHSHMENHKMTMGRTIEIIKSTLHMDGDNVTPEEIISELEQIAMDSVYAVATAGLGGQGTQAHVAEHIMADTANAPDSHSKKAVSYLKKVGKLTSHDYTERISRARSIRNRNDLTQKAVKTLMHSDDYIEVVRRILLNPFELEETAKAKATNQFKNLSVQLDDHDGWVVSTIETKTSDDQDQGESSNENYVIQKRGMTYNHVTVVIQFDGYLTRIYTCFPNNYELKQT